MEKKRLAALHQLASDIMKARNDGPRSKRVSLNEELFNDADCDQISFTLKNYKRPSGVATQIFNVFLSNIDPITGEVTFSDQVAQEDDSISFLEMRSFSLADSGQSIPQSKKQTSDI